MSSPFFRRKILPFLPVAGWYAVIFGFSAQTGESSGALSDGLAYRLLEQANPSFFQLDAMEQMSIMEILTFCLRKAAHMGAYFILTGLLLWALREWIKSPKRRAGTALLLAGLLAALDEFHQTFVPGRSGQPRDVLIDLTGAGLMLLVWAVGRRLLAKHRAKKAPKSELAGAGAGSQNKP